MKQNQSYIVIAIILIALAVAYIGPSNILKPASITGVSQVPIKLDFGSHGSSIEKYYIIRATVGTRSDAFQIVLPKDTEIDLGNGQVVKNSNEVVVKIDPQQPIQTTTLIQGTSIKYINDYNILTPMGYAAPNYYDVQGGMWLTTARYGVSTYNNNNLIASQNVNVNYQNKQEIQVGDIYIENLGILPNGLSVPSGSFVVAPDSLGGWHLYTWGDFNTLVTTFNNWIQGIDRRISPPTIDWSWKAITWNDVLTKGRELNVIPKDVNTIGTVSYSYLGTVPNKIILTLPRGSYSGEILVYVPARLANGIIIIKQQSKAQITSAPDISSIDEGDTTGYAVKVKNVGGSDYIGVDIQCNNYNVQGNTRVMFNENEVKTFNFILTALGTDADKKVSCLVLADGTALSGGDDEKTIYGTIKNVAGFTPVPTTTTVPNTTYAKFMEWYDTPQAIILFFLVAALAFLIYQQRRK